jgi:hypothetical protein
MAKPLKAGGEVDSWCTKCKLFLNHRIIAMLGPNPARVECSTCASHHNFRARPPGEKAPAAGGAPVKRAAGPTRTRGPTKAEQERLDRERTWEKAVSGKGVRDFKPYRTTQTFQQGELVHHAKFGDGVVVRIVDAHKIELMFKDETKTLAQAMTE